MKVVMEGNLSAPIASTYLVTICSAVVGSSWATDGVNKK
jgi:hypothetical protein